MKTRRFDFNYKPLQLQIAISVDGSVPGRQNYNADVPEYTPDYQLTPLAIQPSVSVLDKEELINAGSVNHKLANIRWYEIINGTRALIATDNTNYTITTTGTSAGRILVRKNAEPKAPITLEFYAEYTDTRTNQIHIIRGTYRIDCSNATEAVRVELDAAEQTIYNPLSDPDTQDVTATVYVGGKICTDTSKYALAWEEMADDNTWHAIGADEVLDYDVAVSGNAATVNRRLMGDELQLRCRCKYSSDGTPENVQLSDDTPQAAASFIRRIPKYEYDITGTPDNIPAGTEVVSPVAVIRDVNGIISDPEKELLPLWYIATNKASGSLNYTQVAQGLTPTISTSPMDNSYGAVIGLDVVDRGAAAAWSDADGNVICDADGNVILIH
jgi:hypothetical protein